MNTNEFLNYEAPQVEIVEVVVEKGFAVWGGEFPTRPDEIPL